MKTLLLILIGLVLALAENSRLLENFIDGNSRFTSDLYSQVKKTTTGNFLVCPISIQIILALARVGAKGTTAKELSTTIHIPENVENIQNTFKEVTSKLQNLEKPRNYTLTSANKIYFKEGVKISQDYINSAKNYFDSEIQNVDFSQQDTTIARINNWVAKNTDDKITNLLQPNGLHPFTQLLLINTLYFKGFWKVAFAKENNKQRSFFIKNLEETLVDTMDTTNKFRYCYKEGLAQLLELPYKDSDITMTIALPIDQDGIGNLESRIGEVLETPNFINAEVHVQIPKFTTAFTTPLNNILKRLGIKEAFEENADFSGFGITAENSLKISNIQQKAVIEVDEEGTRAAAASTVGILMRPNAPQLRFEFIANHPFIYYLKSESAGILFVGRYSRP